MAREVGFEPTTNALTAHCSTAELLPNNCLEVFFTGSAFQIFFSEPRILPCIYFFSVEQFPRPERSRGKDLTGIMFFETTKNRLCESYRDTPVCITDDGIYSIHRFIAHCSLPAGRQVPLS